MKNILITGKNSYIGDKFAEYLKNDKNYSITIADTISDEWKALDFSQFNAVFHVAGIAHDIKGNKSDELYFKVNCDLVLDIAHKAKDSGVKQFIFMSSILIYNGCKTTVITRETQPCAKGSYAQSKLKADIALQQMQSDNFKVAILRPPMVFGPNCKGNFPRLVSLAKKTRIFPYYKNQRSMIYIDNLCEFVKKTIDSAAGGIFFPQNEEYFCTSEIVKTIAAHYNRKIWMPKIFNPLIGLGTKISSKINKAFGDLAVDRTPKNIDWIYKCVDNSCSIMHSIETE